MSVRKKYTNKNKTKFSWEFCVDISSDKFDSRGNPIRKQKRVSGFKTEKEAKKAEFDYLKQLEKGIIEFDNNILFKDIANEFLNEIKKSKDYATGTVSNYEGYYNNHLEMFHNMKVKNINDYYIKKWIEYMEEKGASPYVINGCRKFACALFTRYKKKIGNNPFHEMKKRKEQKKIRNRFSIEELKTLIENCKKYFPDFYCIFCSTFLTGMRLGEYTAITKEDINFNRNKIIVCKQYTRRELKDRTKTEDSTREVDFPNEMKEIYLWHIRKYKIFSGFLFKGKYGMPVSPNWVTKRFKELLKFCGYSENYMRVHDLRGQYVDLMHSIGVPVVVIQREVGHKKSSTTNDIYSSILSEVKTDAMVKLNSKIFS